jgi:hypothetical protein
MKSRLSARSLTPLIQSVTTDFEARLIQDSIDGIVRAFVSSIYCMTTADKRSRLLSSGTEEESIESLINFYNSSLFVMIRILNFVLRVVTLSLLLCEHFLGNNDSKGTTKSRG